jgi:hypothetical protein
MDIYTFLKRHFNRLSCNDISDKNDFSSYDNFKNFILEHYQLQHVESNNYIKYVKIKRQMLKLTDEKKYIKYIHKINSIIKIMSYNNVFPNIDIQKYMYKINSFLKLIEDKQNTLNQTIEHIRSLFDLKGDNSKFKFKILTAVNTLTYKYNIFLKYSKQLVYYVNKLISLEITYGIDHKLIELNNMERSFLGKKSEYIANKIITEYTNQNSHFYETNVDLLKLLNIKINHDNNIKGEVDGLIMSFNGTEHIIEKIIEVKSSIKATFEDIQKFIFLQKYIRSMDFTRKISYGKYIFTKNSFTNILNNHVSEWCIYICMNNQLYNIIEKSHLYFSTVLKIVDDTFIKDFYIDNKDDMIKEKYELICKNRHLVDGLFDLWKENINLTDDNDNKCNVFIRSFF